MSTDPMMWSQLQASEYAGMGIEVPVGVARLSEIAEAAEAACYVHPTEEVDFDKLTAGNVVKQLRDAAVLAATREGMAKLVGNVHNELGRRIALALRADHERVVTELRPIYLEAVAVITEASASGLTSSTYGNAQRVIDAGPDVAGQYHRVSQALALLERIKGFLQYWTPRTQIVSSFVQLDEATANPDTLSSAQWMLTGTGGPERWLQVFELPGIVPALNSHEEAQRVTATAQALQAAAEAARTTQPATRHGSFLTSSA